MMKTKKRFIIVLLTICLLLSGITFVSCSKDKQTAPSCDELTEAYMNAGYNVYHSETNTADKSSPCYVKVWANDESEYVFFNFFDSNVHAEEYEKSRHYNILLWLYSAVCGDPTWIYTKTYDTIEYEYEDSRLLKPFEELTNG